MTEARKFIATVTFHYGAIDAAVMNLPRAALGVFTPTEVRHRLKLLPQQQSIVSFKNTLGRSTPDIVEFQDRSTDGAFDINYLPFLVQLRLDVTCHALLADSDPVRAS